jgi:hypothetical protein
MMLTVTGFLRLQQLISRAFGRSGEAGWSRRSRSKGLSEDGDGSESGLYKGFIKRRRPICEIIWILVDKNPARHKITVN